MKQAVSPVLKRKATYKREDLRGERKRRIFKSTVRNLEHEHKSGKGLLILNMGGGRNTMVTSKAWQVLHRTSHKTAMSGYQDKALLSMQQPRQPFLEEKRQSFS
jgi:hypothetical protein